MTSGPAATMRSGARTAAARFVPLAAAGCIGAGLLPVALFPSPPLAAMLLSAGVCAAGAGLALRGMRRSYPHAVPGLCNAVTLLRLVLAAALAAPLAGAEPAAWTVPAVAALALALDGGDGWLARRSGLASAFGARFDMEVDAALALILALVAALPGGPGPWVVLLGLPRYAFAAAGAVLPWLNAPLPDSLARKAVCVVQIAVLIALHLPGIGPGAQGALAAAALAALAWSFGRDIRRLWRARA